MDYQDWAGHYLPLLAEHGVEPQDAQIAADFGFILTCVDQTAFPRIPTPVAFAVHLQSSAETQQILAVYEPGLGGTSRYRVFPVGLANNFAEYRRRWPLHAEDRYRPLLAIAAHEVRHRVQFARPTLIRYEYAKISQAPNEFIRLILEAVRVEQEGEVQELRACNHQRLARLQESWREYDAAVVERVVLHINEPTFEQVAEIVLADAHYR